MKKECFIKVKSGKQKENYNDQLCSMVPSKHDIFSLSVLDRTRSAQALASHTWFTHTNDKFWQAIFVRSGVCFNRLKRDLFFLLDDTLKCLFINNTESIKDLLFSLRWHFKAARSAYALPTFPSLSASDIFRLDIVPKLRTSWVTRYISWRACYKKLSVSEQISVKCGVVPGELHLLHALCTLM